MKLIKTTLLSLLIVTSLSSKPSQAAIGAIASAPVVITAGLVALGIGATGVAGTIAASLLVQNNGQDLGDGFFFNGVTAFGTLGVVGLIVLEGEQQLAFTELTTAEALKLNISESEKQSFNAELDQVNAVMAQVTAEVSSLENPTLADSQAAWMEVSQSLSPESFTVMQKITLQLYRK